jgi:hypothetical protein
MGDVEIRVTVNEKGSSSVFRGNGGRFPRAAGIFRIKQVQDAASFGMQRPAGFWGGAWGGVTGVSPVEGGGRDLGPAVGGDFPLLMECIEKTKVSGFAGVVVMSHVV